MIKPKSFELYHSLHVTTQELLKKLQSIYVLSGDSCLTETIYNPTHVLCPCDLCHVPHIESNVADEGKVGAGVDGAGGGQLHFLGGEQERELGAEGDRHLVGGCSC